MEPRDENRLTVVHGALALISVLLIVQMWLLAATLESFLAGHTEAALPGAIASGLLFAGCASLDWAVSRFDRSSRRQEHDG